MTLDMAGLILVKSEGTLCILLRVDVTETAAYRIEQYFHPTELVVYLWLSTKN